MNNAIKASGSFNSKVCEALTKSVGHTGCVMLHLPVVPEGGLSMLETSDRSIPPLLGVMGQYLIYESGQAGIRLGLQALISTPGLIGVVIDDGVPEVEGDPANGHQW
jgi:hypothetical protein